MVDVPTDFGVLLNAGPPIGRIESNKLNSFRKRQATATECMQHGIDQIGKLAAEAQGLKRPVTSFARFSDSSDDQALYLLWEPAKSAEGGHSSTIFGYLKIVRDRRLYLADDNGRQYVTTPICVLDFFVHQSVQQQGKGVQLFNAMLKAEGDLEARRCAFDKPSVQLLQFLARHFGLERPIWQSTSFVVFHSFFEGMEPEKVSNAEDRLRPMTALERHRRTVNEQYNGQQPMSSRLSPEAKARIDSIHFFSSPQLSATTRLHLSTNSRPRQVNERRRRLTRPKGVKFKGTTVIREYGRRRRRKRLRYWSGGGGRDESPLSVSKD